MSRDFSAVRAAEGTVEAMTSTPAPRSDLLAGLNDAQRDAVCAHAGPLIVVAGPGSGKTRVLTHRIASLLETGVLPEQVLAVTFTNKAASEMRERLDALVGTETVRKMWVGTFHGICLRLLRRHPAAAGLGVDFSVVDADDARKLVKEVLVAMELPAESEDVRDAHSLISRAKNDGLTVTSAAHVARYRGIVPVFEAYQKRLRDLDAVDFDDLLSRAHALLTDHPELGEVYRRRFAHIVVDEFQDTNEVQYAIVRQLGGVGSICVVGDPAQSIYSWRGSRPAVLDEFVRDFPGARTILLEENYRSTPQIVEVCQALIAESPELPERELRTSNPPGTPVVLAVCDDDRDEARLAVELATAHPASQIAVLFRTNAQTRGFEESLTRSGVTYVVVGALRFYERAEIRDALAYLRAALNDRDALALARCANTPRRGLGPAVMERLLARLAETGSIRALLTEAADDAALSRYHQGIVTLTAALDEVRAAAGNGPHAALVAVADHAGLRAHLAADRDGVDRVENLDELLGAAATFCDPDTETLTVDGRVVADLDGLEQTRAFLENVALVSSTDVPDVTPRVVLSTAHAAKGREFDHVLVAGVEDGLFPHASTEDFEEERRLLFVAYSRARTTLTISRCRQRMLFGRTQTNPPSPFLATLPATVEKRNVGRFASSGTSAGSYGSSWSTGSRPQGGWPQRRPDSGRPSRGRDDVTLPAPRKAVPAGPRLDPASVAVGVSVAHDVFGVGEVIEIADQIVTVRFGAQTRALRIDLAPLRLHND